MRSLTVMAAKILSPDTLFEAYKINADQIISIRDMGTHRILIDKNNYTTVNSPISEITLPGLTLFASGVADELLARAR